MMEKKPLGLRGANWASENLHCVILRGVLLLQGSSKARSQRGDSVGSDSGLSVCTVNSSQEQSCPNDPLPASAHLRATSPLRWADFEHTEPEPSRPVDSEQWILNVAFKEDDSSGSYSNNSYQ